MTKKQIFQSFVFICIFVALFSIIDFGYKSDRSKAGGLYWQHLYTAMPSGSHDIVFMGDSHAQCSFMPEVVDDILNTQSVVLVTPGSGIFQKYYEYKEIIKKQPNALVVLETNGIFGGYTQEDLKPWSYSFFDSMPLNPTKIEYLVNYSSPSNYLNYLFPVVYYHREWKTPEQVLSRIIDAFLEVKAPELSNGGYARVLTPIAESDYERIYSKRLNPSSTECKVMDLPSRFEGLDKIVFSSQQKNGKFLLMKAPVLWGRTRFCEEELLTYTTEKEIPYFSLLNEKNFSRLWFHDEVHTTTFGALYVTLEAVPALADNLENDIDQSKYDYYRSYLFEDINTSYDGSNVYIELIPEDEKLSKDLLFKWEVIQNDTVVMDVDYQEDGFITFETNPESTSWFDVHVWINNPDGDFVLEGVFQLEK